MSLYARRIGHDGFSRFRCSTIYMQYLTKLRTFAEKLQDTLFRKNVLQFVINENDTYAMYIV